MATGLNTVATKSVTGADDAPGGGALEIDPANIKIVFVVARTRNGIIGCAGDLPWRLKTDMRHFKRLTAGKPILMGRKTWQSLRGPLVGRDNIVLSMDPNLRAADAWVYSDMECALAVARSRATMRGVNEICVIGGGDVFEQLIDRVDLMHITEIETELDGDTYFPKFDESLFCETGIARHSSGPGDDHSMTMRTLVRRT